MLAVREKCFEINFAGGFCMSDFAVTSTTIEEFKKQVVRSFSSRATAYEAHAQVQSLAALLLSEFIGDWRRECLLKPAGSQTPFPPGPVLEVGCGTGFLSTHLLSHFGDRKIVISDIAEDMLPLCKARLEHCPGFDTKRVSFATVDGEEIESAEKYAAIFSSFALQWFGNPGQGIARMSKNLTDGGAIFFAVPGDATFWQWKALCQKHNVPFTANPLPCRADFESWAADAGLKCNVQEYLVNHHYSDVHSMLKALRDSGTATRRTETALSPGQLRRLIRAGKPAAAAPADSVSGEDESTKIEISYHILYGCLTK